MPQNAHATITTEQLEPLVVAGQVDLDGLGQLRTGMLCRRVNKLNIPVGPGGRQGAARAPASTPSSTPPRARRGRGVLRGSCQPVPDAAALRHGLLGWRVDGLAMPAGACTR